MDFNNTGAMKSPFSPRVRQSISGRRPISSVKKNPSKFMQSEQAGDVIYKTPLMTVETYGLPLPVMVTEVLTLGSGDVSVRMSECGWCWVVSGRRVLAWPRSLSPDDGAPAHLAARELTLPQTDLAHKADLVVVFHSDGAQMSSCVGVSPEGVVRYWPSVGQEGVYSDVSCELAGQECDRLVVASGTLVLATTTCTLVIIEPTTVDGRQSVSWRRLCPASGWLGGLGRRVSLMFFGSMPAHAEARLVGVVGTGGADGADGADGGVRLALLARGPVLQLWRGADTHEHALRRPLLDAHLHGDAGNADVVALDIHACGADELLLLLAISAPRQPERRYVISHVNIGDPTRPVVRAMGGVRAWPAPDGEEPRLLPLAAHALAYTSGYIALAALCEGGGAGGGELVSLAADGDRVLGAALCRGEPLLFSRRHGVLRLTLAHAAPRAAAESPLGSASPADMYDGNLSLFEIDPHEISSVSTDACGKLKTAFLFHLRRDTAACASVLRALFPARDADGDVDGALARTVASVARALLDDAPAGDPRWAARAGPPSVPLGSSAALLVPAHLADKRRALALYTDFLRAADLLPRAGPLTVEGGCVVPCEAALCGLAERLAAAAALWDIQAAGGDAALLIDAAIQRVVAEEPDEEAGASLTPADVCYARVTRTPRVLLALARAPPAAPRPLLHAARALTSVLGEMAKCRSQWPVAPPPQLGPRALLPALRDFVKRTVTEARACSDAGVRAQLVEAGAALARAVLHDAAPLARSADTRAALHRMRTDLILPFAEEGPGGAAHALALADTFRDYSLLVQLSVDAGGDTLAHYIRKYEHEGMAEIAYSWLAARGGRHAAWLARAGGAGGAGGARRARWLAAAPERAPLAALHALAARRPRDAARMLAAVADNEQDSANRMTTAASLGKLCLLASEEESGAEGDAELKSRLEARLALAEQLAALPRDLRLHRGLPHADTPVLPPEDLVQMYVESESSSLTELEYKKALDLTDFVADMERRDDLRLRVWCACIRRDSWSVAGDDAADKMFFRLIDLVHVLGGDLELLLPPLEDILTAPELADLASDPAFHYRLKLGYQCVAHAGN